MTDKTHKSDLAEHFVSGEDVYDGVLLHVRRHKVRLPDGSTGVREFVDHPGAVCILPLFDDGSLLMERQFRYPLAREFIELPAGKIDPGETTLETAQRELREETGYVAREWTCIATLHPLIAYTNERIELWLARGLVHEGASLDHGEFLETFRMTLDQGLEGIRDGRITDVKTVIGLFWAERILSGAWPLPAAAPGGQR